MTTLETARDWLALAEEGEQPGSITHCKILRNDGISSVSLPSGDIDSASESATGVYFRDTRYLSRFRLSLGGVTPQLLDARLLPHALTAVFTNPPLILPGGGTLTGHQLVLRRRRVIDGSVLELLTISNYARRAVDVELRLGFGADFLDIFEVRGYRRRSPYPEVRAEVTAESVTYRARGADGVERTVAVRFSRPAANVSATEATFIVHLPPQHTDRIEVEVCIGGESCGRAVQTAASRVEAAQREWLGSNTSIETNDELLNAAITQSLIDIYSLRSSAGGHRYIAAGVPWFDTLFGRDSLIAGIELAAIAPGVLRDVLTALAAYQATGEHPERDAEPGKIPHELRWGELAGTGELPFGAYYGSVDATPLFLIAAAEYARWTDDAGFLAALRPALDLALAWCERAEDAGGGFLRYARASAHGLLHQGWKDSHDGITWPDGSPVEPPVALVEAQGYLAAAYAAYASLVEQDEPEAAARLRNRSRAVQARIERQLADDSLGYALCCDGAGRAVPTPASNNGHLLWVGAASDAGARRVARLLLSGELFSGWGIRTLSTAADCYNPLGYHTGSVWPHDNALILAGLRRYGLDAEALRVGSALLELAVRVQDYQVPELFSGDARDLRLVPTPYPVSSRPQAWSAAAVPYTLISLLGIRPLPGGRISVTRPQLPGNLEWVRVRKLRRGQGSADILFTRHGEHVAVEVEHIRGGIEVVLSQSYPDPLLGSQAGP